MLLNKLYEKLCKENIQSLFHAGNEPPSAKIKNTGQVFGFSNLSFAKGWKKKHNYTHIYKFLTDVYDIDKKQYIRDTIDNKEISDNEFLCKNVLREELIE